jgi:hypothetical protein
MITISVKENDMRVSVDGRNYSDRDNDVTVSNIEPGYPNHKCIASITVVTPSTYSAALVINYSGAIPFT